MILKWLLILSLMFVSSNYLNAQHERDNWYFGYNMGMSFVNGNVIVSNNNDNIRTNGSSSVSDRITGELLFYTDGIRVWNKNHLTIDEGDSIVKLINLENVYPCIITPFPGNASKYYIFSKINNSPKIVYSIVDMSLNNGKGKVISKNNFLCNIGLFGGGGLAAVNNKCMDGVWLIYASRNKGIDSFRCFEITADSIAKTPVVSSHASSTATSISHWIKANAAGNVIFSGGGLGIDGLNPCISFFDQYTGKISNTIVLPIIGGFNYSQGADFSSDGKKLYVSFENETDTESVIVQYSGANFSNPQIITRSTDKVFGDLLRGSDNKIYISTQSHSRSGLPNADVIENPDAEAQNCNFKADHIITPRGSSINHAFPTLSNTELPSVITTTTENINIGDICLYDSAKIYLPRHPSIDSVIWDFGDTMATNDTSTRFENTYKYTDTGFKTIIANWYVCGKKHVSSQKIHVLPPPTISIGPDTVYCDKGSIVLTPVASYKNFEWNTGEKTDTIRVAKEGIYWVKTSKGSCVAFDSIKVSELPPILIEIGNQFTICDDDNELVKLDAGKGYSHYLWTPTGDTTQWIIVKKTGDYFVVVEDYHGCKGNDDAKVLRQCDFTFFIPNTFTPNGDGLNDVFTPSFSDITEYSIEIYNTWGEKLFTSNDPAIGWDGTFKNKATPIGAYIWQVTYKGFHNKLLRNYNQKGVVNLVR